MNSSAKIFAWCGLALVTLVYFHSAFGFGILNPVNISWLSSDDRSQHLIAWLFLRHAPWTWPLGGLPNWIYPLGTSVAFTDGIPLVTTLLKVVSPVLPDIFQYQGLWLFLCFVLQAFFGFLIGKEIFKDARYQLVAAILFLLSPTLLYRNFHLTLCAHWMLLALLWTGLKIASRTQSRRHLGLVFVVNALAAGFHPTLSAMTIVMTAGIAGMLCRDRQASSYRTAALLLGGSLAATFLLWYVFGYFAITNHGSVGWGHYSADPFTFFNSGNVGRILRPFPYAGGQYEGFSYLGVGIIFLAVSLLAYRGVADKDPDVKKTVVALWPLALMSLAVFVYAWSNRVFIANVLVLDLTALYAPFEKINNAFRSSGRLVWPLYYFCLMLVLLGIRWTRQYSLLVVALILQVLDVWPSPASMSGRLKSYDMVSAVQAVPGPAQLGKAYEHVVVMPPQVTYSDCPTNAVHMHEELPIYFYAALNGLTQSSGYVARGNQVAIREHCTNLVAAFQQGLFDDKTLYFVRRNFAAEVPGIETLNCQDLAAPLTEYRLCRI